MLTASICDNYDFIALQALYTDDFERCEFLMKFIDEVRENMEKMRNDYEEKLDKERASHDVARRESEANVQALRETMDAIRTDYANNFPTDKKKS